MSAGNGSNGRRRGAGGTRSRVAAARRSRPAKTRTVVVSPSESPMGWSIGVPQTSPEEAQFVLNALLELDDIGDMVRGIVALFDRLYASPDWRCMALSSPPADPGDVWPSLKADWYHVPSQTLWPVHVGIRRVYTATGEPVVP